MPAAKKKTVPSPTDAILPYESWLPEIRNHVNSGFCSQIVLTGQVKTVFLTNAVDNRLGQLSDLLLEQVFAPSDLVIHLRSWGFLSMLRGSFDALNQRAGGHPVKGGQFQNWEDAAQHLDAFWRTAQSTKQDPPVRILAELPPYLAQKYPRDERADRVAAMLASWATPGATSRYCIPVSILVGGTALGLHPALRENRLAIHCRIPYPGPPDFQVLAKRFKKEWREEDGYPLGTDFTASCAFVMPGRRRISLAPSPLENPAPPLEGQLVGHEEVRTHLTQDFELWRKGDNRAILPYYLICGPRGTGKRSLVINLATLAKVKVFSPDGLYALPHPDRPFDIFDWLAQVEAQPGGLLLFPDCERLPGFGLGPTDAQPGLAAEVQHYLRAFVENDRERRFLVFATSSRPDLLVPFTMLTQGEDYRLPLFPTSHTHEGFRLLQAILKQRFELELADTDYYAVEENIPWLLTAAEALILATKTYRLVKLKSAPVAKAFNRAAKEHHSPLENKVLEHQIKVAIEESSEPGFVPDLIRNHFVTQ